MAVDWLRFKFFRGFRGGGGAVRLSGGFVLFLGSGGCEVCRVAGIRGLSRDCSRFGALSPKLGPVKVAGTRALWRGLLVSACLRGFRTERALRSVEFV